MIVVPSRIAQITSDPADNIFVECADAARADYLVTGNQRHFPQVLEEHQGDQLKRISECRSSTPHRLKTDFDRERMLG